MQVTGKVSQKWDPLLQIRCITLMTRNLSVPSQKLPLNLPNMSKGTPVRWLRQRTLMKVMTATDWQRLVMALRLQRLQGLRPGVCTGTLDHPGL